MAGIRGFRVVSRQKARWTAGLGFPGRGITGRGSLVHSKGCLRLNQADKKPVGRPAAE